MENLPLNRKLTVKQKFLLAREYPGVFYLQFFFTIKSYTTNYPFARKLRHALLICNN
jgi:hypothetical protein